MIQQKSQVEQHLLHKSKQLTIFQIYPNSPEVKKLKMQCNENEIVINDLNHKQYIRIRYADMIGFTFETIEGKEGNVIAKFHSFPKIKRCFSQKRVLKHFQCIIQVLNKDQAEELQQLRLDIFVIITNRTLDKIKLRPLKLLIYLNPNAGSNSRKHFQAIVDFLQYTNFSFDLVTTTHPGHCKEHLSTVNQKQYEAVIIISGDGLMHQFVNSKLCGIIPVSHVPGGSGNAFAKTQMSLAGEQCRDQEAIFLVVKGNIKPINLAKIQLQNYTEPIYSFLSLQWAFLADIDMNSQFLRIFGGLRFQLYSVYRCLSLRRYRGRLTYSTSETSLPPLNQEITHNSFVKVQTQFLNLILTTIPYISDKYHISPLLRMQDQAIDMQYVTSQDGRFQLIKYLLAFQDGSQFDKEKRIPKENMSFTYSQIKSYRLQPFGQGEQKGIFGIDGERYEAQKAQVFLSDKKVLTFA